jgi:ABC-type multidrug transport system fused ATPase/permease subunit
VNDFLHKLPHGVESLIGEKGVKLSGGERQRVGIARAIYRNPELLFMDEATSHLDVESETKIRQALHEFFKSVTAIVIAHRLSTVRQADKIFVFDKGRIVEEGNHEQLLAQNGLYKKLHDLHVGLH